MMKTSRLLLAGLGVALSLSAVGCKKKPAAEVPAVEKSVAQTVPAPVTTPDALGVERFIRDTYAHYNQPGDPWSALNEPEKTFSPGMVALLKADEKRTPKGEQGSIEADPLCQCQDFDGLAITELVVMPGQPGLADADVSLKDSKESPEITMLQLRLIKGADGWRIDDVIPSKGTSMRDLLKGKK